MGRRSRSEILTEAREHFQRCVTYVSYGADEAIVVDAVSLRLSAGIDALRHLDETELSALFGEDWPRMRGMRNRIAHGYGGVEASIVVRTVETRLPSIIATLTDCIDTEG